MAVVNEIDEIAKMLKIHRYKTELDHTNDLREETNDEKIDKKKQIDRLVEIIHDIDPEYKLEIVLRTKVSNSVTKAKNMFSEMTKMVYMKPWKKLPEFHKSVKIKEYIEKTYGKDTEKSKIVASLLSEAIENKELGKEDYVIYDTKNCEIIQIPVLKETNGIFKLEYHKQKNRT